MMHTSKRSKKDGHGDRPLYNSGSVVADHPREPERPLTLEEMNAPLPELDLRPQRRASSWRN